MAWNFRNPLFTSFVAITLVTVLVKIVAAFKEIIVSYRFGVSDALDAFLIAYVYASFPVNLIAGSFSAALIPTYVQTKEHHGHQVAQRLLSNVTAWSGLFLLSITLIWAALGPGIMPLLGSGFTAGKVKLTLTLTFTILPMILVNGIATIWGAVLNAHQRFAIVAFTPVMIALSTIITVLFFGKSWGGYSLVLGMLAGCFLELIILGWRLNQIGLSPVPRFSGIDEALKTIMGQYGPLVAGALMMTGMVMIDQAMAAMLKPGSVSALNYGNRLVAMLLSLSAGVWTIALPHFSHIAAGTNPSALHATFRRYGWFIAGVSIPATFLLICFSAPIIRLVFERGAFTRQDTLLVSQIQSFYLLQIPFYIINMIMMRLISALKKNRLIMWGAALSLILNIGFNYLFMQYLGVAGIALSTAVVCFASFCYLGCILLRLAHSPVHFQ